jgi:hypothetical protein
MTRSWDDMIGAIIAALVDMIQRVVVGWHDRVLSLFALLVLYYY